MMTKNRFGNKQDSFDSKDKIEPFRLSVITNGKQMQTLASN